MNVKTTGPVARCCTLLACAAFGAVTVKTHAQVWAFDDVSSTIDLQATTHAECTGVCEIDSPTAVFDPGLAGDDITYYTTSLCKVGVISSCGCKARSWALVGLQGIGTPVLTVHAQGYSYVKHRCNCHGPEYNTWAIGDVDLAALALAITAPPGEGGEPATVFFRGEGFSFGWPGPEVGGVVFT